jgi:hypothetical protein
MKEPEIQELLQIGDVYRSRITEPSHSHCCEFRKQDGKRICVHCGLTYPCLVDHIVFDRKKATTSYFRHVRPDKTILRDLHQIGITGELAARSNELFVAICRQCCPQKHRMITVRHNNRKGLIGACVYTVSRHMHQFAPVLLTTLGRLLGVRKAQFTQCIVRYLIHHEDIVQRICNTDAQKTHTYTSASACRDMLRANAQQLRLNETELQHLCTLYETVVHRSARVATVTPQTLVATLLYYYTCKMQIPVEESYFVREFDRTLSTIQRVAKEFTSILND